jgi:putative ABC transport system permease protein
VLRDFRVGWRMLTQAPAYSAVVVAGLAIGFAACFLLLGYVRFCFSFDSQVPDAANVYVMKHRLNIIPVPTWIEFMPLPARTAAVGSALASETAAVVPLPVVYEVGSHRIKDEVSAVDPAFGPMFGIVAMEGDLQAALTSPDALALTVTQARKLFGTAHALGKSVVVAGRTYTVRATLRDAPANTTMPYTALAGMDTALWPQSERDAAFGQWLGLNAKIYLRLKPHVSLAKMKHALQAAADNSPWNTLAPADVQRRIGHVIDIDLGSLRDAYFDTEVANGARGGARTNRSAVLALAGVAFLILALAAGNYVNLATVRTLRRGREIAIRKVIGAGAARLVSQFMAESVLVAVLAAGLGALLAWLLLPRFADLVGADLNGVFGPRSVAIAIAASVAVGIAGGAYPAFVALRMHALDALAGRTGTEGAHVLWLRRALCTLQFAVAIALTGMTLALAWQTRYATAINPGFDPEPLSVLAMPVRASDDAKLALRDALARLPAVEGVAASGTVIGSGGQMKGSTILTGETGQEVRVREHNVSPNFFEVFRIRPLAGRMLDPARDSALPSHVMVINMAAVRAFGYPDAQAAVGRHLHAGYWTIVGVAPDIRDQTLAEPVQATVYFNEGRQNALTLRSSASANQLSRQVEPLWTRAFPDEPFDLRPERSVYAANYAEELRITELMGAASLIAIAIAAFGVVVLSAHSVQRRRREIVLRKLYGAGPRSVALLVGREFALLLAAAAAIGLPPAALAIERYLARYVERAPMGSWPLCFALAVVIVVAFAATARQTLAAMRIAPAAALRSE